jgi:phosphatidylserine synthase
MYKFEQTGPIEQPVALGCIFLLSMLMVSNLKFASFKEFDLRKRKPFPVLLGIIVLLILIVNEPQIVLFTIGVLYVVHGPVWSFLSWRSKREASNPPSPTDASLGKASNPGVTTEKKRETSQ